MRAITHIATSTVAAAITGLAADPAAAAGVFVFGGFVDVDHVPHLISSGLPADPGTLFRSIFRNLEQLDEKYSIKKRGIPSDWLFPAFHCVEFVLLLAATGILTNSDFLLWGSAGIILHLFMDIKSYPCSPKFFSIIWRYSHRKKLSEAWTVYCSKIHR